jgi:hypothetical protein
MEDIANGGKGKTTTRRKRKWEKQC